MAGLAINKNPRVRIEIHETLEMREKLLKAIDPKRAPTIQGPSPKVSFGHGEVLYLSAFAEATIFQAGLLENNSNCGIILQQQEINAIRQLVFGNKHEVQSKELKNAKKKNV